ncbi:hypothetical protein PInf_014906 [Phytophthora infestans]|nr:hypothetical protein PInf_014906 [Phytophthora infestans]
MLDQHEGQPHTLELFQRDLCKWVGTPSCTNVDDVIDELKEKTQFLRQVIGAQQEADPINVSCLTPAITQAETLREKLVELERVTNDSLVSKWVESDLFGSADHAYESECACPWKFQQENTKYLHVEDRRRARHQFRLHQCDESTDRVLKETFYPVLEQFREVQIGMALFTYPKLKDDDDKEAELAIAVMIRRQRVSEGALKWLNNLVSAYRQLSLSPYVQQYLGSEDISATKQELEDVTTRHYFEFVQRLLPDNVMISHSGRRLFLGKLDFGDYVDPFQSKSLSTVMQKKEKAFLQDLSVILFSMLYPVTLPRNLAEFRTRYLGRLDRSFVFRYRISCKSKRKYPDETAIKVSCGDTFAVVIAGSNPFFDDLWSCQLSDSNVLTCTDRRIRLFRLHPSKAQTLISACAAESDTSSTHSRVSARLLLHQHDFFQPQTTQESHEVERELLARV